MEDKRGEEKKNGFIRLLETRHAKRAFKRDRPVPSELVELVLTAAANGTPSTQNTQPWGVTVVQGQDVDALRTLLLAKFDRDETDTPEYQVPHPSARGWRVRWCVCVCVSPPPSLSFCFCR